MRIGAFLGVLVGATFATLLVLWPSTPLAGPDPAGVDLKIRAQNRSTADTPFCGVGGGLVGDRLDVDAFMDTTGFVTGTARFEDALGNVTLIDIDRFFSYFGGVLVQNEATQSTVPIWLGDFLPAVFGTEAVQVNVELPRGCENTVSTFTPGVDKVTVQIKFRH